MSQLITILLTTGLIISSPTYLLAQQEKNPAEKKNALSLITFKGTFQDKFIKVKWSPLASPEAIKIYLVEYSQDGKNFETIGQVYPELANFYKYNSIIYHAGANYFRIVQVNKDGSSLVSQKINVMCGFPDRYNLKVEQLGKKLKLKLQVRSDQKVIVEILNPQGKLIKSLFSSEMLANEMIFKTVDTTGWKLGKYYLSLRGETFRESQEIKVK